MILKFCRSMAVGLVVIILLASCGGNGNRSSSSMNNQSSTISSIITSQTNSSIASSQGQVAKQCLATNFKQPANVGLEAVFDDRTFIAPTGLVFFPGNDNIAYVHEQRGQIYRLELQEDGSFTESLFVDLTEFYNIYATGFLGFGTELECFECGLFSMAFHPDFNDNGYIY